MSHKAKWGGFWNRNERLESLLFHGRSFLRLGLVVESHLGFHASIDSNTLMWTESSLKYTNYCIILKMLQCVFCITIDIFSVFKRCSPKQNVLRSQRPRGQKCSISVITLITNEENKSIFIYCYFFPKSSLRYSSYIFWCQPW